jgi:MFS family permease
VPDTDRAIAFYGWRIVGVCFLTLFVSVGFGFYSFGPFFKALAAEFGGGRLGIGVGLAVFNLTNGLVAPFLGRALDGGSARRIMTAGTLLLVAGLLGVSQVRSLGQFYLVLGGVMALGAALIGGLTASTLVANWFVRRRGMALGIATMGISMSGVVMAPVATTLIEHLGWRWAFVVYAGLTAVLVLPVVRLFVVDRPEDLGLHPDGAAVGEDELEEAGPGAGEGPAGIEPVPALPPSGARPLLRPPLPSWTAPLRERSFWIIAVVVALNFCANGAVLTHIIAHATDLGFAPVRAAFVLSCIAGLGVVGKVLFGWISDRIDKRAALWLASALQMGGVALFLAVESYPGLLGGAAVFGLGMGGLVPLWGTLIGACYGRRSFGRVMGLMSPLMLPIQILGVPFAGWVFDRWGSYTLAFETFLVVYFASMLVLALLRLPSVDPDGRRRPIAVAALGPPAAE